MVDVLVQGNPNLFKYQSHMTFSWDPHSNNWSSPTVGRGCLCWLPPKSNLGIGNKTNLTCYHLVISYSLLLQPWPIQKNPWFTSKMVLFDSFWSVYQRRNVPWNKKPGSPRAQLIPFFRCLSGALQTLRAAGNHWGFTGSKKYVFFYGWRFNIKKSVIYIIWMFHHEIMKLIGTNMINRKYGCFTQKLESIGWFRMLSRWFQGIPPGGTRDRRRDDMEWLAILQTE